MNPSNSGWIIKFLHLIHKNKTLSNEPEEIEFYKKVKSTGFIYGISTATIIKDPVSKLLFTKEEFTKVNLFYTLIYTYNQLYPQKPFEEALRHINRFYRKLETGKRGFLPRFTFIPKPETNLEYILTSRIQSTNTVLKKNSASLLTYALLQTDVLAFKFYLQKNKKIKEYGQHLEKIVIHACFFALKAKLKKGKYDILLIEMFESSSGFLQSQAQQKELKTIADLAFISQEDILVRRYILDLCCLAVWDDREMDTQEYKFLQQLTTTLQLDEEVLQGSIEDLTGFSQKYARKIKLFEYSHPVKQFYKQSSKTVKLLILRNKNRLLTELLESGELLVLLGKSTHKDLTTREKHKVKEQLLDICKSIPSLTIFLVPGGSLLLPLLIKFIPKLLPSAFQENRIDDDEL